MELQRIAAGTERYGCQLYNPGGVEEISEIIGFPVDGTPMRPNVLYYLQESTFCALKPHLRPPLCLRVPDHIELQEIVTLLEENLRLEADILQATQVLTETLWSNRSMQNLAEIACSLLGNPVFVNDFTFQCIAASYPGATKEPVDISEVRDEFLACAKMEQFQWYNTHRQIIDEGHPQIYTSPDGRYSWILGCGKFDGIAISWVVVYGICHTLTQHDLEIVKILCHVTVTKMRLDGGISATSGRSHDLFLRELLSSAMQSHVNIRNYAEQVNFQLKGPYCIVAIQTNEAHMEKHSIQLAIQQIKMLLPHNPIVLYDRYIVLLITQKQDAGGLLNVNYMLREFLAINGLKAGMSRPYMELLQTPAQFQEAISILDALSPFYPNELLLRHGKNLTFQMIWALSKHYEPASFQHPALQQLRQYDLEHNTALLPTLKTYLKFNCSPSKTAQAMYLHRNTINKRLEKIKELINEDLNNGDVISQLSLSFAIDKYCTGGDSIY